jgi:hypothetical protein
MFALVSRLVDTHDWNVDLDGTSWCLEKSHLEEEGTLFGGEGI